jgi:hypothetical protein
MRKLRANWLPIYVLVLAGAACWGLIAVEGIAQDRTRPLAPGILTVIPPAPEAEETYSGPLPLVEIPASIENLEYTPNYEEKTATIFERSKNVFLRRGIWNLEFAFKPLRMLEVDVPQPSGKMQRKLIWYMVYRVKNAGGHLQVKEEKRLFQDAVEQITYKTEVVSELTEAVRAPDGSVVQQAVRIRFFPHFVLESKEFNKAYLDRVIPAAMKPILDREFPPQSRPRDFVLHDSVSISSIDIPLSEEKVDRSVWGVVTWEDVDPRIDYLSVYVQGLTNAYKFEDVAGGFKKGEPPGTGRKFVRKTLQLNFWRPSDTVEEKEDEIRFGVRLEADPIEQEKILKLYGVEKPIDHRWLYR